MIGNRAGETEASRVGAPLIRMAFKAQSGDVRVRELLVNHIDCLIPLVAGIVVLLAPQILTKKDLAAEENASTRKRLRWAGVLLVVAAVLIFVATVAGLLGTYTD